MLVFAYLVADPTRSPHVIVDSSCVVCGVFVSSVRLKSGPRFAGLIAGFTDKRGVGGTGRRGSLALLSVFQHLLPSLFFEGGDVLVTQRSPFIALKGGFLPVCFEEVQACEIVLQFVFVTQPRASFRSLFVGKLSIQKNLRNSVVIHTDNMTCPAELICK